MKETVNKENPNVCLRVGADKLPQAPETWLVDGAQWSVRGPGTNTIQSPLDDLYWESLTKVKNTSVVTQSFWSASVTFWNARNKCGSFVMMVCSEPPLWIYNLECLELVVCFLNIIYFYIYNYILFRKEVNKYLPACFLDYHCQIHSFYAYK